MSKFYIKCGTLEIIHSTHKDAIGAAATALWESNKFDVLDEHFYIDERGYRDHASADKETQIIKLNKVAKMAGWSIYKDNEP